MRSAHKETVHWTKASEKEGRQWVVCIDEIGPAQRGVDPDDREDNNQDTVRAEVLWGNLMGGGSGAEWYFGYKNHNNDLGCEDWRSRDRMWDYTSIGIEFFQKNLPFWEMESSDKIVNSGNYAMAKTNEIYVVYLPYGGEATINLSDATGEFEVNWFNPRTGGDFITGKAISGGAEINLGSGPYDTDKDWAVLIKKK